MEARGTAITEEEGAQGMDVTEDRVMVGTGARGTGTTGVPGMGTVDVTEAISTRRERRERTGRTEVWHIGIMVMLQSV